MPVGLQNPLRKLIQSVCSLTSCLAWPETAALAWLGLHRAGHVDGFIKTNCSEFYGPSKLTTSLPASRCLCCCCCWPGQQAGQIVRVRSSSPGNDCDYNYNYNFDCDICIRVCVYICSFLVSVLGLIDVRCHLRGAPICQGRKGRGMQGMLAAAWYCCSCGCGGERGDCCGDWPVPLVPWFCFAPQSMQRLLVLCTETNKWISLRLSPSLSPCFSISVSFSDCLSIYCLFVCLLVVPGPKLLQLATSRKRIKTVN